MKQPLPFWQVDAFTNVRFKGNPAAITVFKEPIDDDLMQSIAIEMNLSETAFVLLREGQNPLLRWFTPMSEIDLCGHATLAAAHIYLTELYPNTQNVIFDTKFVGPLQIDKNSDSYTMNFPSRPGNKVNVQDIPLFVLEALTGAKPVEAYKSRDLMLVYEDESVIRSMSPDLNALMKYDDFIMVTAKSSDPRYDYIARFFCADDGIAEDPVTGSAHCTSAPYWAKKLAKNTLKAYQASKRGGELFLEMAEDRVLMTGGTVTVIDGTIRM